MTEYNILHKNDALKLLDTANLDGYYGLSFFQTREGLGFFESTNKETFSVALMKGKQLIGIISGVIDKENGIKSYVSRRGIIYGGPVLSSSISADEVGMLLDALIQKIKKKVIYIETRNFFNYDQFKTIFKERNFIYNAHLNFHLATKSEEVVRKNISKSKLRYIKRSLKEGAEIVIAEHREEIVAYYGILHNLYKTKVKTPLPDIDFFIKLFEQKSVKFILIKFKDEILGGIVCALFPKRAVYEWFVCGEDRKYKNIYPSILATWAGIEYAFKNGYEYFDFMGAGKPDEEYGVRDFKKSFGGELIENGRFLYIAKPRLYKLGKIAVTLLKKSTNFKLNTSSFKQTDKPMVSNPSSFKIIDNVNDIERSEWTELNKNAENGTVFQSPEMFDFWGTQKNSKPFICAITNEQGNLMGLCSGVFMSTGKGLKKAVSRRAIVYGGPIFKEGIAKKEVAEQLLSVLQKYVKRKAIYLEIRNSTSYATVKDVFEKDFNYIPYQNFLINLESEEEVFAKFTSEKRRQIRRALREGCEISYENSEENVQGVYSVLAKTYKEKVKKPLPEIHFFKELIRQDFANIIAVMYHGEIIGGGFFLYNDKTIYDWYRCGNDITFKHQYPSTLTAWGVMLYGLNANMKQFDFMGAGIRGEEYGVRKFKAQFGGELVEYGRYMQILNPVLYKIGVFGLKYLKK
ncbi:peptidoglycan bridge formation glycyltransferase FemA/FemB family protein [Flavobacteriaceae bacterium F08102]|nr:peptidoglycan bridge formation glycyltransferase FemA/FemB family protein [Flavobacteriaceae bacterium F08102]